MAIIFKINYSFDDEFKNDWGCCLANFEHIAVDPIELKDCNGYTCSICYENLKRKSSFCSKCANEHEVISKGFTKNRNLKPNDKIIELTRQKIYVLCKSIEKERLNEDFETVLQSIRDKIEMRTDFQIHEVIQNKLNLEKNLEEFKEKFRK